MTNLQTKVGSFTTVNGVRYTVVNRQYPKDQILWDGGPVGGRVYPVNGDHRFTFKDGYFVSDARTTSKSFPTFIKAADHAQARQRKLYDANVAFVAAYEAALPKAVRS